MSDITATLTETVITATVTNPADIAASLGVTEISATVVSTDINASVTSSPVTATLVNGGTVTATVSESPITAVISMGIEDAPSDGDTYGRKDGAWIEITSGGGAWGDITGTLSDQTDLQSALDAKVDENAPITGATKTKITYDAKGLVTAGADATQDDIGDGVTYKQYSDAEKTKLAGIGAGADISGTGVIGRVAEFVTDTKTIQAANLIAPSANILTLTNAAASTLALNITAAKTLTLTASDNYTLTIPATGTAALLARDQDFTGVNKFYRGAVTSNTFLGGAGNATLTGGSNIGIGNNNQTLLSTGANNVGVGNFALRNVTTGSQNFGLGYGALENIQDALNNVALGFNALQNNVSGLGNIGVGHSALNKATDIRNTAVGYLAGRELTSGARCIFLGSNSGLNQTTLSNLLIIDSQARVSAAVELTNAILYGVMGANPSDQTLRINAVQTIAVNTTTTNAPLTVFDLNAYVSTAATGFANGGGVRQTFTGETATDGTSQLMANITSTWIDATNATRKAKLSLSAYDTAARLGMEIQASGTESMIGFHGVTPIARAVLATGAGATVDDVITALQNLGLVKQS